MKIPLPTLPTIAIRLLELFDNRDVDLSSVVELLQSDPAIAARIIKSANSSCYGVGREVTDLQQAVALLGKTVVTSLAMSFSLAEKSMQKGPAAELFRSYWLQAITQAVTAECLARHYAKQKAGEWFLTGLLSSIGRLSLINHDPELYAHALSHAETFRLTLHEAEQSLFGTTTVELSAELLAVWKLPQRCIDAVANQLRTIDDIPAGDAGPQEQFFAAIATAAAVGEYFCQNCQGESLVHIVHLMEEAFDAGEEDVDRLIDSVRNRLEATSGLFQINCSTLGSPAELMSLAMQHLAGMAVVNATTDPATEPVKMLAQQNERLLERIRRLTLRSTTDALTGVFNRGYFDDRLTEQVAASVATSEGFGLILVDVDHFKSINDTHGHLAGDEILRQLATVLCDAVRSSDVVARYGGEEFVVMVTEEMLEIVELLSERIRHAVEDTVFCFNGIRIPVTVSVGAATGQAVATNNGFGERLIAAADRAMYESKKCGRNRITTAEPVDDARLPETLPC